MIWLIILTILIACGASVWFSKVNRELRQLATIYHCFNMPRYSRSFTVKSKKSYDNFNLKYSIKHSKINNLDDLIYESAYIKREYGQYKRDAMRIVKQAAWYEKIGYKLFLRKLNSKTWNIHVSYTSPKGRNHYEKNIKAAIWEAIPNYISANNDFSKQTNNFGISKRQVLDERHKMTKKLRYRVLKRDHYRCVICGRGAKDGVKLHVDHIKPVAQGGKTVLSNLRTLCADCNLGKSDHYDPKYHYAK